MESVGRAVTLIGRIGVKIVESAAEGLISGGFSALGPRGVSIMIERDYHTLDTVFNSMDGPPDYAATPELTKEDIAKLERMRLGMQKTALSALGMARNVASRFPREVIENKITAEWLLQRVERRNPDIAQAIKSYGEKGDRWLEDEARIIRLYFMGRMAWSAEKKRLVEVQPRG